MQETNYTAAFGMETEEVLHGPVAALGDAVLVAIAPPGAGRQRALDLLRAPASSAARRWRWARPATPSWRVGPVSSCRCPPALRRSRPRRIMCRRTCWSYWLAVARHTVPDLMRRDDPRYLDARKSYTL